MAKIKVIDLNNTPKGEIDLPEIKLNLKKGKTADQAIFDQVIAENAGKRQGTHSTLTKAEVRGGGKKPVPQKHTGNARQGSIRNPHYVGGGVVFGPKPNRNYLKKVNKKVSTLAFKAVLADKMQNDNIIVLSNAAVEKAKTRDFAKLLKLLKLNGKRVLFLFCAKHANAVKATRNIAKANAKFAKQVSVGDILLANKILLCENAANGLLGGKK